MFEKDRVFYKGEDYSVRMEKIGGCERYYIKFDGQADSKEIEISLDVFVLYYKEFRKPLDRKRNEKRRHIADGDLDGFIISGKLTVTRFEQECIDRVDMEAVLKRCTPVQQRRYELHTQGYSMEEIAKIEKCSKQSVSRSIAYVIKKLK